MGGSRNEDGDIQNRMHELFSWAPLSIDCYLLYSRFCVGFRGQVTKAEILNNLEVRVPKFLARFKRKRA